MVKGKKILAADIGGTNSRFGIYHKRDGEMKKVAGTWLGTAENEDFAALLGRLATSSLGPHLQEVERAVFAVAGPVEKEAFSAPAYIPWTIDTADAVRILGCPCELINDFVAQAYACRARPGRTARQVLAGHGDATGIVAVIGAGTGLGKAALVPLEGGRFNALSSEGGHAAFPFVGEREHTFARFYERECGTGFLTLCDVLSGRGLAGLHAFLTGERLPPPEVSQRLPENPQVRDLFARFYGRACRDFALDILATGGVYVAGGVAAKNPALIFCDAFAAEFRNTVTMGRFLDDLPVYLMDDEESGLWGAALRAAQHG